MTSYDQKWMLKRSLVKKLACMSDHELQRHVADCIEWIYWQTMAAGVLVLLKYYRKYCRKHWVFPGAISSLQVFITVPVCVICISQNLYICDLRSGQSRDHYITSLGENNAICPAWSKRVKTDQFFQGIMSDSLICNDSGGIYWD